MISLTVTLEVREDALKPFLNAITENAERTFTDEPGCLSFDVNQEEDNPRRFIFYELYEDLDALAAHRRAPHFAAWRAAADQYVMPGSQVNTVGQLLIRHGS